MNMEVALLTSSLTLVGAIILFLVSELSRGLFIGPLLDIRRHIGLIIDRVIFYIADLTSGAAINRSREEQIRVELRALSTQLRAKRYTLAWYHVFSAVRLVPTRQKVEEAAGQLMGLANSFRIYRGEKKVDDVLFAADYERNVVVLHRLQNALGFPKSLIDVDEDIIEGREERLRKR
jgi:hypothetical protein